ncbi:MAG: glycosyltransferase family 2 protein [Limisphaerales bacterium]
MSTIDISIVVPVYNEEESITPLYEKLTAALVQQTRPYEIIFVNDGSSDRSFEILSAIAAKDKMVKAINFRRNFGQTAAMTAGFDFANGRIIIPMDGDLQNDPEDIPLFVAKLEEGYDVVSGWRKDRQDKEIVRKIFSRVANRLIASITGVKLHDSGCSMKAYRSEVLKGTSSNCTIPVVR